MKRIRPQAAALIRRAGGYLIRRAGLLPGGVANGIGEDKSLLGTALPHEVMVFFPDSPGNLYQLEHWYGPLRELAARRRLVVVLQDSRTARAVRRDSGLDAIVVARQATMDDLVARGRFAVCLYVNHHPDNFWNMRFGSMLHVSMLHGDSDKSVSVSHQLQAYDFAFVAGQAAVDRIAAHTRRYDAAARCIPVGRPQLDQDPHRHVGPRPRADSGRPTVLYAPTWEGSEASSYYGSVVSHGPRLVRAFLDDGWDVHYRPHPLTGVRDPAYRAASDRISALVEQADATGGTHRVESTVPLSQSFSTADLLVCDVSGVAVDWLAVDRPLLMTRPSTPGVVLAETPLTALAPAITSTGADRVTAVARTQIDTDPLRAEREALVEYYLGDITPGAATARFIAAVERLIALNAADADPQDSAAP